MTDPAPMTVYRCTDCRAQSLAANGIKANHWWMGRKCAGTVEAVPYVPLADARRAVLAELTQPREALAEAEKGIGSLLWVMNNRHNWADSKWDGLAEAAEEDARRALGVVRSAAAHLAGEGSGFCAEEGRP